MSNHSRRQFLKQLGAFAGLLLAGKNALPFSVFAESDDVFDVLVVGDSFIWCQGMREEKKFYYIVKEWLRREVFDGKREVNLKVKAHSGARIFIHDDQIKKMRKVGEDPTKFHHPEVDISFPSIEWQVETARKEYENPASVKLVMVSGGITDMIVGNTINPFLGKSKFRRMIHDYLNVAMAKLLEQTTAAFPNAQVVVVGYFPIVSTKSDVNKITKYLMKVVKFPHPLQFLFTNDFSKQFMKIVRKETTKRSRIWLSESNKQLREAVRKTNEKLGRERVIFVETPIPEEKSFATKNSMLFGLSDDNLPEDEIYEERKVICSQVFKEIKYKPFSLLSNRFCELASVAHVNYEGSKAYAEAIKTQLKPIFAPAAADKP